MPGVAEIVADPSWLPHRLVDGGAALRFVRADRDAQRAATFLDDESLGAAAARADLRSSEVMAAATASEAPLQFIFHSAFACSTLLARAMDLPGIAMGLKEPIILNDATQLLRARRLDPPLLDRLLGLLARPFAPGEANVVKPSNAANPLMTEMMRLRPQARAILLYRDLPGFLRSIARKGMFGRIWARRQLAAIHDEVPFDAGLSADDLFAMTDLQAAGYGWLIQQAQFATLARAMPERVRLMAASELLGEPARALSAVLSWYRLALPDADIAAIVAGPVFDEDAKRPGQTFENNRDERSPVDDREIAMVVEWIGAVARHVGQPIEFGPRLLTR